jgi:GntR family transcriptional regulator/MocR family aminotransferase
MIPYSTLVSIDKNAATPVYLQIVNGLIKLIRDSIIKPGASLPSSREMAALLRVHRKTIIAAYDELYAQDWIETIPRKGIIVSQHLPELKPRTFKAVAKATGYGENTGFAFKKPVQLSSPVFRSRTQQLMFDDGFPDARIAPVDLLMREYSRLFKQRSSRQRIMYGDVGGSFNLRNSLVQFLSATRALNTTMQNILMTHGAQMAIHIAASLIIKPGSTVIVGKPNYFMADMIFQQLGAKLAKVPVDENGIDINAIEKICKRKKPAMLYIIPHHHHPTTVTLSADRRMKLLQLIREENLPVIEDDYDYDFHYSRSPILPLASADHNGNVIYIGSLTKTLAPSVRMGYMVAGANFIKEAANLRRLIDIRGDDVFEEALAALFANGTMQRHFKKSVKLYQQRRDLLCERLQELTPYISFTKPAGGMAVWTRFNKKISLPDVARRAAEHGLSMSDGSTYNYGNENYNALRIGFASLNEKEIEESVSILKKVMKKMNEKVRTISAYG